MNVRPLFLADEIKKKTQQVVGFDPAHDKDKSVILEGYKPEDGIITITTEHISHFVGFGYIVNDEETQARKMAYALCQIFDNAPAGQKRVYLKKYGHYWKGPYFVKAEQAELTA